MSCAGESFLENLTHFGMRLGLERMRVLLDYLDHPEKDIPAIHVAGTNGKGSVCAFLSHALLSAGYRVGRYTSPHLVTWEERIWVNGSCISTQDWIKTLEYLEKTLAHYASDQEKPTQFEVVTAAAWLYFQQQQVDIVVLEVGLGGRLDATNVGISPAVTVVTSIGWDHMQWLGSTLTDIAQEKAGICKANVPLVSAPQHPEVISVLEAKTQELGSSLWVVSPATRQESNLINQDHQQISWQGESYLIPLLGDVQLINASIALEVLARLQAQGWILPLSAIQHGFRQTYWPGRLQKVSIQRIPVWLDGAHNQPAAAALRKFIDQLFSGPAIWFIGILKTKDAQGILQELLRPEDYCYSLPISHHASLSSTDLSRYAHALQPLLRVSQPLATLQDWQILLKKWSQEGLPHPQSPVILCGSLYLIGEIMNLREDQ